MKKLFTITGITAVLVVGGLIAMLQAPVFASNSANIERAIVKSMDEGVPFSMPPVSLDEAQATVMAQHPGAAIIEVKLHGPVSDPVWKFELFTADGARIEVNVHAETGMILKTETEAGVTVLPATGFNEAKTAVLTEFPGATIIKAELERDDGVLVWEFRLLTSDGRLLKVDVDGATGALVLDREIERMAAPTISLADAKATVMAEFPGAIIERAQLKDDEAPMVWHFRLITADGLRVRVDVDAETGDLLEIRVKDSGGSRSGPGNGEALGIERDDREVRQGRLGIELEDDGEMMPDKHGGPGPG